MKNIKNKIIFGVIFAVISIAGIAAMIFAMQKVTKNIQLVKPEIELAEIEKPARLIEKETVQPQSTLVDTDYFSLVLPDGWEGAEATNTLPIIIVDSNEKILNEKAKEINFRTNVSINSTELGDVLFKDYVEIMKTNLIQAIPNIEIVKEKQYTASGREAYFMEIKSVQQDLKFRTFIVLAFGKNNTVWAFSFNALQESWPDYKDIFQGIINSIKMK